MIITDNYEVARLTAAPTAELALKADVKIYDNAEVCDNCDDVEIVDNSETCDDVEILGITTVHRPIVHVNVLQQLNYRQHKVYGDGNYLYYAVAHQAGYTEHSSHGDNFVGKQLRMLALTDSYAEVSRCKNRRWTITASVGTKEVVHFTT